MPEVVTFFLAQLSLLAVVLVLHTYMGLHIIRRGLIFCDLALDQLAALGAIVGLGLGVEYGSAGSYLLSLAAVTVGAALLAVVKPKSRLIPREAVIGILYGLALAASLMTTDKLSRGADYLTKTLTGSLLWVTWPLIVTTAVVYAGLIVFHFVYRERFVSLAEEPGKLKREELWDFLFFASQGVITILIVPIAGVLLAFGFLMIPAAMATMFTRGWVRGTVLGWSLGFVACVLGVTASYLLNWPYGPTLLLSLGLFFFCALALRALLPTGGSA
ncbi:MAG: metal ABC transporter permease [Elusimicrobiota bacterium]